MTKQEIDFVRKSIRKRDTITLYFVIDCYIANFDCNAIEPINKHLNRYRMVCKNTKSGYSSDYVFLDLHSAQQFCLSSIENNQINHDYSVII